MSFDLSKLTVSLPHKYISMDTLSVNFLFVPAKQKAQHLAGLLTWEGERELGSQDFGEVATDSTFVGTVELHHVFLDTSLADD